MSTGFEQYPDLYGSTAWRNLRASVLSEEPLCRMCDQQGRVTAATVVDHVREHKGDRKLFFDRENLQPLCASCHSGRKRVQDRHGYSAACGVDGQPSDPGHPWNRGKK